MASKKREARGMAAAPVETGASVVAAAVTSGDPDACRRACEVLGLAYGGPSALSELPARVRSTVARHADRVVELLARPGRTHEGLTAHEIRGHLNLNGLRWGRVRRELLRRGVIEEQSTFSDPCVYVRLAKTNEPPPRTRTQSRTRNQ